MFTGKNLAIFLLSVLCAFLLGLYLSNSRDNSFPFAHAEGAANGLVVTTGHIDAGKERLYIVDTEKKVICAYDNFNGKFRLCGIHSFKYDLEFNSSSGDKEIEGNKSGADYEYMKKKFERGK